MNTLKFDAPLAAALSKLPAAATEARFDVSVRAKTPLTETEAAELRALGAEGVTAGRRIFPARVSFPVLCAMAEKSCVTRVSLAQKLRLLSPDESEAGEK